MLGDANNTLVLLPRAALVAKVATSTLAGRGAGALERELRLGRALAELGAPIVQPADEAGPHEHEGTVLTLWRYHEPGPPADARQLGAALRQVHAAVTSQEPALPSLRERVAGAVALVPDGPERELLDLAYLPPDALALFPERDEAQVVELRQAVSLSVAAWCLAQPGRAPEVDEAAQVHLATLSGRTPT